jgi:hypothetical protein
MLDERNVCRCTRISEVSLTGSIMPTISTEVETSRFGELVAVSHLYSIRLADSTGPASAGDDTTDD